MRIEYTTEITARLSGNQNLREPLRPLRFKASKRDQPRGTQGFAEKNLFEKQEAAGLLRRDSAERADTLRLSQRPLRLCGEFSFTNREVIFYTSLVLAGVVLILDLMEGEEHVIR